MAATTNKQQVLNKLFSTLQKAYPAKDHETRPILEQFIYGLCYENATREQADKAYNNLTTRFIDWNEIRVSSVREVQDALENISESEERAQRIIGFLQEVFEMTFSFDLEDLHKKKGGMKQAALQLSRYQAANDFVVAWVVQHSLGGHAIPLDEPTIRTTGRLGFIDQEHQDKEASQSSLEHLVAKAKGPLFTELIKYVGHEYCWEQDPNCSACPLSKDCPTGQENLAQQGSKSRNKPR